jgi:hypothetical protein
MQLIKKIIVESASTTAHHQPCTDPEESEEEEEGGGKRREKGEDSCMYQHHLQLVHASRTTYMYQQAMVANDDIRQIATEIGKCVGSHYTGGAGGVSVGVEAGSSAVVGGDGERHGVRGITEWGVLGGRHGVGTGSGVR